AGWPREGCATRVQHGPAGARHPTVGLRWCAPHACFWRRRSPSSSRRPARSGLVPTTPTHSIVRAPLLGTVFSRTLRKGTRGADVKTLQTWLRDLGYTVPITGYFGIATQKAVKTFQAKSSLRPVSGTVGHITAATLLADVRQLARGGAL